MTRFEDILKKEISDRKRDFQILSDDLEEIKNELQKELKDNKAIHKIRLNEVKLLQEIKNKMLEYTLQIIAIVVAIMAIIMTFSFLSTDFYSCPNSLVWFLYFAIGYFLFIFSLWVAMWYKNSKTS